MRQYGYQAEKFSQARSNLMAPHFAGEAQSFASAFIACSHGLRDLNVDGIEYEQARIWIATIQRLMSTAGVEDPTGEGTYLQRARQMTNEEKSEFSKAVDELASWFSMEFWSAD